MRCCSCCRTARRCAGRRPEERLPTRGALVQCVLQRYQLDPTKLHPNPAAQQLQVANLEALKPWLY